MATTSQCRRGELIRQTGQRVMKEGHDEEGVAQAPMVVRIDLFRRWIEYGLKYAPGGPIRYYTYTTKTRRCLLICHNGLRIARITGKTVLVTIEHDVGGALVTVLGVSETDEVLAPRLSQLLWGCTKHHLTSPLIRDV